MKKIIIPLLILLFVFLLLFFRNVSNDNLNRSSFSPSPTVFDKKIFPSPVISQKEKKILFVPYWSIGKSEIEGYDELIYFGIAASKNGINKEEEGYKNIYEFLSVAGKTGKKLLAIRMIDSQINSRVLEDKVLQNKIIIDSIAIAKDNLFDGILLDFELSSLSFESVIKKINTFVKDFNDISKKNNLIFSITLYGDTFYRFRPYDVEFLGKHTDEILIMAYDFHKARENPGPNFPLHGKDKYGYDLASMVDDFSKLVLKEKLNVVFGLFGYDWMIDDKGQSLKIAESKSLSKMESLFFDNGCKLEKCVIKRDNDSKEMNVIYIDENKKSHSVWFEDMESIEEKRKFLKSKGINSIGFWAHSYY